MRGRSSCWTLYRLRRHLYGPSLVYVRIATSTTRSTRGSSFSLPLATIAPCEKTERQFHEDVDALGALRPIVEPRATEHIAEMRTLIERLVAAGNAYVAEDHVLFSVPSMQDYGKLSKRSLDEMMAGARVEVAPYKRDAMDFVLWKPSKPGEPGWPSPSVAAPAPGQRSLGVSWKHLGRPRYGGGIDLVFPHHERDHTVARFDAVMRTIGCTTAAGRRQRVKASAIFHDPRPVGQTSISLEVLRLNMLKTHYRQPLDWTQSGLQETLITYGHFRQAAIGADRSKARPSKAILAALSDDLNTPLVISELHQLAAKARSSSPGDLPADAAAELVGSLLLLGFERAVDHVKADNSLREDLVKAFHEVSAREIGLNPAELDALVIAATPLQGRGLQGRRLATSSGRGGLTRSKRRHHAPEDEVADAAHPTALAVCGGTPLVPDLRAPARSSQAIETQRRPGPLSPTTRRRSARAWPAS